MQAPRKRKALTPMSTIEELTLERLDEEFGCGIAWWTRHRPRLVRDGVVSKKGRKFFGAMVDVETWLRGRPQNANMTVAPNMSCAASVGGER